jgi:hypothetical protein
MTAGVASDFSEAAAFLASGKERANVIFTYRDPATMTTRSDCFRLVRDRNEQGSGCVFVTSLIDDRQFTWGIEVAFKDMKSSRQKRDRS